MGGIRVSDLKGFTDEELEAIKNSPEIQQLILDGVQETSDPYGYPEPPSRDNLLKFFRDILALTQQPEMIAKAGNLRDGELGFLGMPVRNYMDLALFSEKEDLDVLKEFFNRKAEIVLATSLSRKAKLMDLAVSQKRVSQSIMPKTVETKSGIFGSTTVERGGMEE